MEEEGRINREGRDGEKKGEREGGRDFPFSSFLPPPTHQRKLDMGKGGGIESESEGEASN